MAKKSRSSRRLATSTDGGRRIRVSPHPPEFVSIPWFNLVVRIENPPALVTTVTLQGAIASQLGITFTGGNVGVRLQSVRAWGALTGGPSPLTPISVVIFDPIVAGGQLNRVLEQITDYPDQVTRACIGYKYPKAQREVNLVIANVSPLNLLAASGLGPNSVVYFRLQWRPNNVAATIKWLPKLLTSNDVESDDDEIEVLSNKAGRSRPMKVIY